MSFRSRLTLFFVLIVIVPMVSLTFVLFRLIADNANGKADARVAARQDAAIHLYDDARARADTAATRVGGDVALATALQRGRRTAVERRAQDLLTALGLKRILITSGSQVIADVGSKDAIFPATRKLVDRSGKAFGQLQLSAEGPRRYTSLVNQVTGLDLVVTTNGAVQATTLPGGRDARLPSGRGTTELGGKHYRAATFVVPAFAGTTSRVTVLDSETRITADVRRTRLLAAFLLAGFFILAFIFAMAVSRSLQRQIEGFLDAARRLGSGDFKAQVPTVGRDEFAALGTEFNQMASKLEEREAQLRTEQNRFAGAMRRLGEAFESNLDREALLEIVLRTALDGTGAVGGRATLRSVGDGPLDEVARAGELEPLADALHAAESQVLEAAAPREVSLGEVTALAHPLRAEQGDGDGDLPRIVGIVAIARVGGEFTPAERELFHYLAGSSAVSVENVGLHQTVERQAVTDELTGLSNRRRFQDAMAAEIERSRRFGNPIGLVMLDIDDFKKVNDSYGHQVGDLVLKEVAHILKDLSREIDLPARYGGEELAVVLPGTDLEGAYNLAERVRLGIEALRLPVVDEGGKPLRVTASFGAATVPGSGIDARALVEAADSALYEAKRSGKNRTIRAHEVSSA
jgi:diguanylate cyclase (GGDEF)-like protein